MAIFPLGSVLCVAVFVPRTGVGPLGIPLTDTQLTRRWPAAKDQRTKEHKSKSVLELEPHIPIA